MKTPWASSMLRRGRPSWALWALWVCFLFAGCDQGEKFEREIGYKGVARKNPYLAAERFFEEFGHPVSHQNTFARLPYGVTVITPLQSFVNYGDTKNTLGWVERGGHLIVFLTDGEEWTNDWQWRPKAWVRTKDCEEEQRLLLETFHIEEAEGAETQFEINVGEKKPDPLPLVDAKVQIYTMKTRLAGKIQFSREQKNLPIRGGEALAGFRHGEGWVTFFASAKPFRNRYIADGEHAKLLLNLAALGEYGGVYMIQGTQVSFLAMLWEHGWMALAALAALVLAWLWRSFARFGPIFEPAQRATRDFAEHLRLSGNFLWRWREYRALLSPLQQEVQTGLARRGIDLTNDTACAELAERTGVPLDRLRQAVNLVEPASGHVFLRTVQDLQTIRAKL